ncbi:MAG: hypothetical protein ABI321_09420 [Polyangia bacterium]
MADDPTPFKLPKRLEVTDLEGKPSLPPLPTGAASSLQLSSIELEDAPLDLEPPRVYADEQHPAVDTYAQRRQAPWAWVGGVLFFCALAFAGYHYTQTKKTQVEIELVDAPASAQLVLDGQPIEARVIRLTRSGDTHRVTVFATGRAPKTVTFTALEDATVELGP